MVGLQENMRKKITILQESRKNQQTDLYRSI